MEQNFDHLGRLRFALREIVKDEFADFTLQHKDIMKMNIDDEPGLSLREGGGIMSLLTHELLVELKPKGFNYIDALRRKKRKDKIDGIDTLYKVFLYRFRLAPFIISGLALVVSVCAYFKPEEKSQQPTHVILLREGGDTSKKFEVLNELPSKKAHD